MFIIPRKKVPVVSMTLLQWIISPDPVISTNHMCLIHIRLTYLPRTTPVISGCSFPSLEQNSMSSTESSRTVKVGYFLISSCMLVRYWSLSICALSPHTADPFLLFSTRYWMPDTSAKRHYSKCVALLVLTHHTLFHTAHPEHQFPSSNVLFLCHQTKDYRTSHLDGNTKQTTILHHMKHMKYFSCTGPDKMMAADYPASQARPLPPQLFHDKCCIYHVARELLMSETRSRSFSKL